jgi:hypothetical protein
MHAIVAASATAFNSGRMRLRQDGVAAVVLPRSSPG